MIVCWLLPFDPFEKILLSIVGEELQHLGVYWALADGHLSWEGSLSFHSYLLLHGTLV